MKKLLLRMQLVTAAVFLCGCGTMNVFQSSAEYQRADYAKDVKNDIDRQIRAELGKEVPLGSLAQTYSAGIWANYWMKRIAGFRSEFPRSKEYRGPTGAWFADYIVSVRSQVGLPDLPMKSK